MIVKPMLAYKATLRDLEGAHLTAQPKIDGIRALVQNDGCAPWFQSRSGKQFRNNKINKLAALLPHGLDGEFVIGDGLSPDCCRKTNAILGSYAADIAPLRFIVFDRFDKPDWAFSWRWLSLLDLQSKLPPYASLCHTFSPSYNLGYRVQQIADEGWIEGTIFRDPNQSYKHGRSTLRERKLIAIKPFTDAEARIVGVTELMHNTNELTRDELGFAKRSSAKAGKVPSGMLGTLICKSPAFAEPFEIGTGFTQADRIDLWHDRPSLLGRIVKFKYLAAGTFERPRCPVFLSFRMKEDTDHG